MTRSYTVEEIDRMRTAIANKHGAPEFERLSSCFWSPAAEEKVNRENMARFTSWQQHNEEKLRSYMLAGVAPEELEKPIKERKAALEAEFPLNSWWRYPTPPDDKPPMRFLIHTINDDGTITISREEDHGKPFWIAWKPEFIRRVSVKEAA